MKKAIKKLRDAGASDDPQIAAAAAIAAAQAMASASNGGVAVAGNIMLEWETHQCCFVGGSLAVSSDTRCICAVRCSISSVGASGMNTYMFRSIARALLIYHHGTCDTSLELLSNDDPYAAYSSGSYAPTGDQSTTNIYVGNLSPEVCLHYLALNVHVSSM